MADVYLHSRFTEDLINLFPSDIHQNIAFLGSQGPDAFYYGRKPDFRKVADDIHRYRTRDLFKTMIAYVKKHKSDEAFSYLFGFISHYVLDIYIHPYVYYKTGVYDPSNPSTYHMRGLHKKFEHAIDLLQIQKELNINPKNLDLTKKYVPLKTAPKPVLELMAYTLEKEHNVLYGIDMMKKSIKAMYHTTKYIATDRYGIKKVFYKLFDSINKENDIFISDLSTYNQLDSYDYHNDAKNTWYHPLTGEEYTTSIGEMIENAKEFGLDLLIKVYDYIYQNKDLNLDDLFTDLSFNTGKECSLGMTFKYIDIYNK